MVKKYTNEHDYYKPLRAFLTYHFGKTAGNETKLATVLHYCKTNWARISEHEIDGGDLDENVKTLLEIQPMDIARYFKYLAYGTETPAPGRARGGRASGARMPALDEETFMYTCGQNSYGELGHEHSEERFFPEKVKFLVGRNLARIAAGNEHTAVLADTGDHSYVPNKIYI